MDIRDVYREVSKTPLSEIGFSEWCSEESGRFWGHKHKSGYVLYPQFEMREDRFFLFCFGRIWVATDGNGVRQKEGLIVSNILDAFLESDSPYVFHGPIDFRLGIKKHLIQMVDQLCAVLPSIVDEMTIERLEAVENDGSRYSARYQADFYGRPGELTYEPTEVMI